MINFTSAVTTARTTKEAKALADAESKASNEALKPSKLALMGQYKTNFNNILESNLSNIKATLGEKYIVNIYTQDLFYLGSTFTFDILSIQRLDKRYGIQSIFSKNSINNKYSTVDELISVTTSGLTDLICNIILEDEE